jgi:hypothetical protein
MSILELDCFIQQWRLNDHWLTFVGNIDYGLRVDKKEQHINRCLWLALKPLAFMGHKLSLLQKGLVFRRAVLLGLRFSMLSAAALFGVWMLGTLRISSGMLAIWRRVTSIMWGVLTFGGRT